MRRHTIEGKVGTLATSLEPLLVLQHPTRPYLYRSVLDTLG